MQALSAFTPPSALVRDQLRELNNRQDQAGILHTQHDPARPAHQPRGRALAAHARQWKWNRTE